MIALETLSQIDAVANRYGLYSGDVRILLSAQLPSWITPVGEAAAQALLAQWLAQGIADELLARDLPRPVSIQTIPPLPLSPQPPSQRFGFLNTPPTASPAPKRNLVQLLAERFHRPAR